MKISLRTWFLIVLVCSAGLLGFAFYQQYWSFLDPCPLCIFQRVGFIWIAAVAAVAAVHHPGRAGGRVYGVLVGLGASLGAFVAGRHVWLQSLPPDQVPECGPGLNYMLENFPLTEALSKVFLGSGSCAEVHWTFLGLSMPGWTLTWFLALGLGTLLMAFRDRPAGPPA